MTDPRGIQLRSHPKDGCTQGAHKTKRIVKNKSCKKTRGSKYLTEKTEKIEGSHQQKERNGEKEKRGDPKSNFGGSNKKSMKKKTNFNVSKKGKAGPCTAWVGLEKA